MLAQPHFEAGDQLRLGRLRCRDGGPTHADLDEVSAKEPGAEDSVMVAPASSGARTATGSQMLAERRQIDVVQVGAVLRRDMAEMSCRAQIAHCRRRAIALLFERRCETVEVRPAWPAPQMSQHLRCREVGLQHVRPRLWPAIGGQADGAAGANRYGDEKHRDSQENGGTATPTPLYWICP
jgi:hypothetical protein